MDTTLEIINASFIADEPTIFGEFNEEYAKDQTEWYKSQSKFIFDIPNGVPKIWQQISNNHGMVNSNYGWCIFSEENYNQFDNAIESLKKYKHSKKSAMIHTRPAIHWESQLNGMKDFITTYATQFLIRDDELHYMVFMSSTDAIFEYDNNRYWHDVVFNMALEKLLETYPNLKKR